MKRSIYLAHGVEALGDGCVLQGNRKAARGVMHAGAGILHRFGKVPRHLGSVMERERTHSEPFLQKLAGGIEFVVGDIADHRIQSSQMVTHIGKHMLLHPAGKGHEFALII